MRLGWQLLLPLAVLNVVVTAIVVALGWSWWVNFVIGMLVIAVVLVAIRLVAWVEGTRFAEKPEKGTLVLPTSVYLAKFERVVPTAEKEQEQAQDAKAVQV